MSDIVSAIKDVPATFSSWDSCMSKAYCKWPVIAAIIVAALVVLSVVWCFASCLCCGATLCGSCIKCLTCCNCCGACGRRDGGSGRKRNQDDYTQMPPTPYQGYQPQPAPMVYNQGAPSFATFDASSKKDAKLNEDALPAMPSWDTAPSRRVEDYSGSAHGHGQDVEMGRMQTQQQPRMMRGGYGQVPNGEPMSPIHENPHSQPYDSNLGAQRMGQSQHYQQTPLSPAPTYRTAAPFAAGAMLPDPYPQQHHYNDQYSSTANNTRYEPSYMQSTSPPPSFHSVQPAPQGYRPPSLLQVGRKPVNNSYREV